MGQSTRPTVTLEPDTDEWVRSEAERRDVSISAVINDSVRAAAGAGETPYLGEEGDTGPVTVGDLHRRLKRLESPDAVVDDPGIAADPDADVDTDTVAQIRSAVEALDWDNVQYARRDNRVDGVVAALESLAAGRRTRSGDLAEVADTFADVSAPGRLLSGVARQLDCVETPVSGSDRYEWVGFNSEGAS